MVKPLFYSEKIYGELDACNVAQYGQGPYETW